MAFRHGAKHSPPASPPRGPQVARARPVTIRPQIFKNRHILLAPCDSGSLGAPVKQVEIQLRFPPASHVRVVSAIANLTPEQNSRRSKNDGKSKLSKMSPEPPRMNQDAPEATPGGPRRPFRVQNRHLDETQKLEDLAIRAVSWHLRGFQKTTGPHLSGRQGGFKRP